jgi:NhaP-type Na+/H+ and K+/H+ antiporter
MIFTIVGILLSPPLRLLLIGLPLTIIFSTYVAKAFFPNESILYLLLLALILAPTDAALGKAVVSEKSIPLKIRSSINVESGLNDGIVFPVVITLVAVILSTSAGGEAQGDGWLIYVIQQVVFGAIIGTSVGYFGARLATWTLAKNWMENNYQNLIPIALAIFSFYLSESHWLYFLFICLNILVAMVLLLLFFPVSFLGTTVKNFTIMLKSLQRVKVNFLSLSLLSSLVLRSFLRP